MSGIVGLMRPDGAPVDKALAWALTRFLAFRGPDGRDVWSDGSVALGHAMLRTTEEAAHERQPAGLQGEFWITADARLDARGELIGALAQAGREPARSAPDGELILQAYAAWGEECLQRLRGDFAFGIWDAPRKTLFCARDHLGIKPFYFAEHKDFFLFSNTLDCVRMHPEVPDDLNEAAIADFLLFGLNCDPAATTFRAIRRLPPAHFLRVSADGLRIGRYWSIPIDGRIRYARDQEYIEHFRALLRDAVSDRLHGGRVGIFLSGGLDSSSVAATARELSPERGEAGKLRAYTVTCGGLVLDRDGPYAKETAEFLGIPIRFIAIDRLQLFEAWDDTDARFPEPVDCPLMAGLPDEFRVIAEDCRVVVDCEGPDNLMDFQMWPYARYLLRNGRWRQFGADMTRFLRVRRFPWRGICQRLKVAIGADPDVPRFPKWLAPDFARRTDAEARWRNGYAPRAPQIHPVKPRAHASMFLPHWTCHFESVDSGVTGCPVGMRYPFLDLRIVNYMLALPSFPWSFQKTLLREAMTGRLPESVRRRPKTPLASHPAVAALRCSPRDWASKIQWTEGMERFVNPAMLRLGYARANPASLRAITMPLRLNYWLRHSRPIRYKLLTELRNG